MGQSVKRSYGQEVVNAPEHVSPPTVLMVILSIRNCQHAAQALIVVYTHGRLKPVRSISPSGTVFATVSRHSGTHLHSRKHPKRPGAQLNPRHRPCRFPPASAGESLSSASSTFTAPNIDLPSFHLLRIHRCSRGTGSASPDHPVRKHTHHSSLPLHPP